MAPTPSARSSIVRWFISADIRQAHRCPPDSTTCSRSSGTSGTPTSAIDLFSREVAIAVIPGSPPRPCGMCVAVLPSIVNFRSCMVFLFTRSKPQNVKKMCVSTPSPSAALARISPGYAMSRVPLEQMIASLRSVVSSSKLGRIGAVSVVMSVSSGAQTQPRGLGRPAT
jgi:hypothetical protein